MISAEQFEKRFTAAVDEKYGRQDRERQALRELKALCALTDRKVESGVMPGQITVEDPNGERFSFAISELPVLLAE